LRRVVMAFTIATAGTAAMVGTAQAATLSINPMQACYISGEKAVVSGAGFTPSGQVNATFAGQSGVFNVDAAGNSEPLNLTFPGVKGITTETITETDTANPAITAALAMTVTSRHVDVNPTHAKAGKKLRIKGYGLTGGPKVYMHVRGPHHYRSDTKIAKAQGPCGTFKTHRTIVGKNAAPGAYKVRFDHKKKFSKKTKPQTGGTLTITRTFHATSARAVASGWRSH